MTGAPSPGVRIAVLGGGISGLTAAYRLTKELAARGGAAGTGAGEVILLEASGRLGGAVRSESRDGFLLEHGPDSFLTVKPAALRLCRELGLETELTGTNPQWRRSFVLRGGRLHAVPDGFHLFAPSSMGALAGSGLFSLWAKIRMAMDLLLPASPPPSGDESLASFVRRRLGQEALDLLAQPMAGGIYTADPEKLSLAATLPRFLDLEREHGSVIRGLWNEMNSAGGDGAARAAGAPASGLKTAGPRYGLFVTLRNGMESLVRALASHLPPGSVRTGVRVDGVQRPKGKARRWTLRIQGDSPIDVDALLMAVPAREAGRLLGSHDNTLAWMLEGIPSAPSAVVHVGLRRGQVAHPLDGFGFVVPAVEGRTVMAASFESVKFQGRAPAGQVLVRAFAGGELRPDVAQMDDAALTRAVMDDLCLALGVSGEPVLTAIARHRRGIPQYRVGHLDRVRRIDAAVRRIPGLALAGNAFRGVGMPDCVASAEAAARLLLEGLAPRSSGSS